MTADAALPPLPLTEGEILELRAQGETCSDNLEMLCDQALAAFSERQAREAAERELAEARKDAERYRKARSSSANKLVGVDREGFYTYYDSICDGLPPAIIDGSAT